MSMVGKVGEDMAKVRWGEDGGFLIWSMEMMVSSLSF